MIKIGLDKLNIGKTLLTREFKGFIKIVTKSNQSANRGSRKIK